MSRWGNGEMQEMECSEDVQAGDIVSKIVSSGNLVESAQAFDVYSGKGVARCQGWIKTSSKAYYLCHE